MNLMCVDQRSGESAETARRVDNSLKDTFLNVCWRQELLEGYFAAASFSLPLAVTIMSLYVRTLYAEGRHHNVFYKVFKLF